MSYNYLLVDGNHMAWRSASVLQLSNQRGENTSVSYGVLSIIRSLIEDYQPGQICVCWDKGGSKAKRDFFPDYKKERRTKSGLPEGVAKEVIIQISKLQEMLPYFGIKQIVREGVEADDLIGLLCKSLQQVLVVSGDKGMFQVVSLGSSLFYPHKNRIINQSNFLEEVGMSPEIYPFFLSIVGHPGGGIPGLKGFGPITAKNLFSKYGSWRNWYVDGKIRIGVLEEVNKKQKAILLYQGTLPILERNLKLLELGGLVDNLREEILKEFQEQNLIFDEEMIKKFFFENQFNSYLARFRGWIHPFRSLS